MSPVGQIALDYGTLVSSLENTNQKELTSIDISLNDFKQEFFQQEKFYHYDSTKLVLSTWKDPSCNQIPGVEYIPGKAVTDNFNLQDFVIGSYLTDLSLTLVDQLSTKTLLMLRKTLMNSDDLTKLCIPVANSLTLSEFETLYVDSSNNPFKISFFLTDTPETTTTITQTVEGQTITHTTSTTSTTSNVRPIEIILPFNIQ
jgi:hypothetical protein